MKIKPWPLVRSTPAGDFHIFKLRKDLKTSPRTHREMEFVVIESVNWVNVVAITKDQKLVMVEQYRHGSGTIELEIPGGVMDAEDASALDTGVRELLEETGFGGTDAAVIGEVWANPAIMNNKMFTVLVKDCVLRSETRFDHGEDIAAVLIPLADIPRMIKDGRIRHSLVVAAFHHYHLHSQSNGGAR